MADDEDLALIRSGSKELEKVDLREADLSGRDFFYANLNGAQLDRSRFINTNLAAADLRNARIVGADFSGADLRGAKLPRTAVAVKFVNANLRGTRVVLSGQNIDFTGADLVGADFTGSKFGADVLFDGVQTDEKTNFDGVEMLRATSRYPAFSDYDYEKGKLVRRKNLLPTSPSTTSSAPQVQVDKNEKIAEKDSIIIRLEERPRDLALMATALSAAVQQELENIQHSRPNEPAELAVFERYSSFLVELASSLDALSMAISEATQAPQKQLFVYSAKIVQDIKDRIERWSEANSELASGIKQTSIIGLGIAFLSVCGAPPTFASAISAATFGGPKLAKAIKDYYGKDN